MKLIWVWESVRPLLKQSLMREVVVICLRHDLVGGWLPRLNVGL